jgi:uracil phosphoribosyltransferase
MLMCYEVTRGFPLTSVEVETPVATARCGVLDRKLALIPILRAGLGMVESMLQLIPTAKVGHIGLYRDPDTLRPVEYYCKLPDDIQARDVLILDPMLGTGGTAAAAVQFIKEHKPRSVRFVCLLAAPEGIAALTGAHPELEIYTCAVDERLNDLGYIVPGLGDAGDRIFGTK